VVHYNNNKPFPEVKINLPPSLFSEAWKEYNIHLSKRQINEIQEEADRLFKNYWEKCKSEGNFDASTGYPKPEPE